MSRSNELARTGPTDELGNRWPRQPRGLDRRQRLVEVAADLLWAEGIGAVSHRSVARAAGVPLGSTTYYFSTLATLIAAVVEHLEGERSAQAERALRAARPPLTPRRAAQLTVLCHLGKRTSDTEIVCRYEMYVAAARFAEVRRLLLRGRPQMLALTAAAIATLPGKPPCSAEHAAHVLDGAVLEAVIEGRPAIAKGVAASLTELYS